MRECAVTKGVLNADQIRAAIEDGAIALASAPRPRQIQPASIDLTLGARGVKSGDAKLEDLSEA